MSSTHRIVVGSKEWAEFHIAVENDPTLLPVEIALVPSGSVPVEDDWRDAVWAGGGPTEWNIRLLVGDETDETDYVAGVFDAFARIVSGVEVPIVPVGAVEFYGGAAPRLCDPDELGDHLRTTSISPDDASADLACDIASEVVRAILGQTVTLVEDDPLVIEGAFGDRIRLPERPVVGVASVTVDGQTFPAAGYNLIGEELILTTDSETFASIASGLGDWGGARSRIVVTYSHGYSVVPADIKGLALGAAAAIFQNPANVQSEGILSYRVAYKDAEEFVVGHDAVVNRYRRSVGTLSTR